MAKFTDNYFTFPIKIYDGVSLRKAKKLEEDTGELIDADWISGIMRFPVEELVKITWHDGFSSGRDVKDVNDKGFDLTIIYSNTYGDFVSLWSRKKFEAKMDEFMERWTKENVDIENKTEEDLVI